MNLRHKRKEIKLSTGNLILCGIYNVESACFIHGKYILSRSLYVTGKRFNFNLY